MKRVSKNIKNKVEATINILRAHVFKGNLRGCFLLSVLDLSRLFTLLRWMSQTSVTGVCLSADDSEKQARRAHQRAGSSTER